MMQSYEKSPGYPAYQKANDLFVAAKNREALAALEQALRADEKLIPALTLYAKIAMTMNRFDKARASLERALSVDANAVYARFLYGLSADSRRRDRVAQHDAARRGSQLRGRPGRSRNPERPPGCR